MPERFGAGLSWDVMVFHPSIESASFFSLLQKNVLDRRICTTREELRIEIGTRIERTYNTRRRQTSLGRLTPIEDETVIEDEAIMTPASKAA